jgi:hypothetical protein
MTVLESVLADRMGLDRKVLREQRKKAPVGAWGKSPAGIHWTRDGLAWLDGVLKAGEGVADDSGGRESENGTESQDEGNQAAPVADVLPLESVVKVVKIFEKNRRLLRGELADGSMVRVRVKDNVNFVPGMEIPCIHQSLDLWCLNGRLPQARGKLYRRRR